MNHLPAQWNRDRLKDVAAINPASLPANTDLEWFPSIPSVWRVVRFKSLFRVIYRYPTYFNIEYVLEGIPEVRGEALTPDGFIERLTDERYISAETSSLFPMTQLEIGDIVMSVRGTMGKIGIVDERYAGANITANLLRLSPDKNLVTGEFLRWLMRSMYFSEALNSSAPQTTIKTITMPQLAKLRIALPPLPEQERIAGYLDASCAAIDAAVTAKRRQIETLDALRKSIIQKAVTKGLNFGAVLRDSGDDGLGDIPSHWRTDRMKDVVELRNEKTDVTSEKADYLELEDIEPGSGRILNRRNTLGVESAVTIFKKGDILFGKLRPYLEKYVHADFDGKCTGEILAFKPTRITSHFLFYCIASPWFIGRCNTLAYGAKMPRVNWQTQLASFNLPLPPAEEQEAISGFLDTKIRELGRIVENIESQIATLTAHRKSLIHECVTGQRRISEADVRRAAHSRSAGRTSS